jgi:hypothetical protein
MWTPKCGRSNVVPYPPPLTRPARYTLVPRGGRTPKPTRCDEGIHPLGTTVSQCLPHLGREVCGYVWWGQELAVFRRKSNLWGPGGANVQLRKTRQIHCGICRWAPEASNIENDGDVFRRLDASIGPHRGRTSPRYPSALIDLLCIELSRQCMVSLRSSLGC